LQGRLKPARRDYGWLSEETADDRSRLTARRSFVVDPIDGTRAFIKGRPEFVVSIAIVESGEPVAAALFDPSTDRLWDATRGGGARLNGAPIRFPVTAMSKAPAFWAIRAACRRCARWGRRPPR
jgi:myo-inositol-1(or 4)-monophosphatase